MPRRGSWTALSASYRARLERGGVTAEHYESGGSLTKARGHAPGEEYQRRKAAKKRWSSLLRRMEAANKGWPAAAEVTEKELRRANRLFGYRNTMAMLAARIEVTRQYTQFDNREPGNTRWYEWTDSPQYEEDLNVIFWYHGSNS